MPSHTISSIPIFKAQKPYQREPLQTKHGLWLNLRLLPPCFPRVKKMVVSFLEFRKHKSEIYVTVELLLLRSLA